MASAACRFKQDFTDKYKYDLVHKDVGHTKVKELILWLMMDAVEVCSMDLFVPLSSWPFPGACNVHDYKLDNRGC